MQNTKTNSLLKFLTCGSVDDGKSTLIGHMLYDAKLLFADQEQALELDSKAGSTDGKMDYSLLLDGLMAEREQGITIDIAYRYFTTDSRSFIVADSPGHEEYTRNMAVGASFAELAIILVDSTKGVLVQTRRHTRICSLMGIRDFVFAVNKMDLINYDKGQFQAITKEIEKMLSEFSVHSMKVIPVSATEGDNITKKSEKLPWYHGMPLLQYLEEIEICEHDEEDDFCMPVQRICRPNQSFRGFQGQIEAGSIMVGEEIKVLPSGEKAHVKQILIGDKDVNRAVYGQPVNMQLDREIDISRGCVLTHHMQCYVGNLFSVSLLWMDDISLVAGKNFLLKCGTKVIPATIQSIKYKVDVNTGEKVPVEQIFKNEIAYCEIAVAERIVFDKFEKNRALGGLILIDRVTNMTSACGIINDVITRSDHIKWQEMDITREIRARQMGQKPITLWFTGLSGSGKSTIANALEKRLSSLGKHTMTLDGDNIRFGLSRNLGFKQQDRIENIRRIAEVAKLMNDAGLIVLTAFISPYESDRESAREIVGDDSMVEIYISTPLDICEKRDVKGLYKKARLGEVSDFTGISSPYEIPSHPEMSIDTTDKSIDEVIDIILKQLTEKGKI